MKRQVFIGHLIGFVMMTGICFVALSCLALFVPFIGAFLTWSLAPITFDLSNMMFVARGLFLLSALIGVMFTSSKEGREFATDYAKEFGNG